MSNEYEYEVHQYPVCRLCAARGVPCPVVEMLTTPVKPTWMRRILRAVGLSV